MLHYRDSRIVRTSLIIFFVLLIGYAFYEAQGILYGPVIDVPSETVIVTDPYTVIRGTAERITELRLNGKTIPVTERGEFEEPFLVAAGTNHLILEARDARGRRAHETITVIYQAPHEPLQLSPPKPIFNDLRES